MGTEQPTTVTREALVEEIHRYLELLDAIRAAGNEPTWKSELVGTWDECGSARTPGSRAVCATPRPRFTV